MTLSTTRDLASRPKIEYKPALISNTKKDAITIKASTRKRAVPILSIWVYLRSSIATTSVPPLEAPILNSRAEANPGIATAKHNSSIG